MDTCWQRILGAHRLAANCMLSLGAQGRRHTWARML